VDKPSPVREMILGLAAVIVQHDALAEQVRGQHRRNGRKQERCVRSREHVHDVVRGEPGKPRHIHQLIQNRPRVRHPSHPSRSGRKPGIDGNERGIDSIVAQQVHEGLRLYSLPPEYFETRRNDGHTHQAATFGLSRGTSRNRRHHISNERTVHRCRSRSRPRWFSLSMRSR
jgi:hypothetical protein